MRHYFLDSSAVVKLYALESGSAHVRDIMRSAARDEVACRVLVCDLVQPETASALYQIAHGPGAASRGLSHSAARRALGHMLHEIGEVSRLVLFAASDWVRDAALLVWKHGLKGADAIHLAAAMFAKRGTPHREEFYFVTSDRKLGTAAAAEGLTVIDPST